MIQQVKIMTLFRVLGRSPSIGIIAGPVVGGVAVLTAVGVAIFYIYTKSVLYTCTSLTFFVVFLIMHSLLFQI